LNLATSTTKPVPAPTLPVWAYALGLLGILVALFASGGLAVQHLTGKALPGCGTGNAGIGSLAVTSQPASPCSMLEAHPMGSLGGMKTWFDARSRGERLEKVTPQQAFLPVSFLGASYFAAGLVAWIIVGVRGRRVGSLLPWVVRLGALISAGYLVVIVVSNKLCPYCITSHIANLALWMILEIGMRSHGKLEVAQSSSSSDRAWGAVLSALIVFAGASVSLGVIDDQKRTADAQAASAEAEKSAQEMQAKAEAARKAAEDAAKAKPEKLSWGDKGFTGRWLFGPTEASVRVVVMSSYQCPHCRQIEDELFALQAKHADKMSISQIHFPLCPDCNPHVKGSNPHPNSCWAARAAEAGAIIAGSQAALEGKDQKTAANEAFWKWHKWLFARGGTFTDADLNGALPGLGYPDVAQFNKVMQSPVTAQLVKGDADIAVAVGLQETPMIFINGVELRGWRQPGVITRTIESLVASNPPSSGPQNDRPLLATEKYLEDWRQEPFLAITDTPQRSLGPADAKVTIVMWGDFTEPNTKKAYEAMVDWTKTQSVRIFWRHFPGAKACNPQLPKDFFPMGCTAAKASEAALAVGGTDAFWKMAEWLFANREGVTPTRVNAGAAALGLDNAKFAAAMAEGGAADQVLAGEAAYAKAVGVDRIPKIYVNGRHVRQWISEDNDDLIIKRIVDEAMNAKPDGK
jgi:protein-disulfide isomerase